MSVSEPSEVTRILRTLSNGKGSTEALYSLVYAELRALAATKMAADAASVSPTSLVHQAYIRLVGDPEGMGNIHWQSRAHFFGAAAEAMRRILIDHARKRRAKKRGSGQRPEPMDPTIAALPTGDADVLELNEALIRLESNDERMADIVKLRFFAGLTIEQTALALDISTRTVNREWNAARAWLHSELTLRGAAE